ncbi:MAG: hypothetical protein ACYC6C_00300, partial [Coriobacteriia bacterium]
MSIIKLSRTNRKLVWTMLAAGIAIGVAFPLAAQFFVEPKSPGLWIAFWVMCMLAGVILGILCIIVAVGTGERMFR